MASALTITALAAAVHAALSYYGIPHGAVIVLGLLVIRRRRPARHLPIGALIALFGSTLLIYSR